MAPIKFEWVSIAIYVGPKKVQKMLLQMDFSRITMEHLRIAMHSAVDDAEGSLKRTFDDATLSYGTDMYKVILRAASNLNKTYFSAEELRRSIREITGNEIPQQSLNNYLRDWCPKRVQQSCDELQKAYIDSMILVCHLY